MRRLIFGVLALLLCLLTALPTAVFAEGEDAGGVLDPAELQAMLDAYIEQHHFDPERISVGFVYTATGESWYHNPDRWYYSASMYKVPLMMILAEKEYLGELTRDSNLKGLTLGQAEELILTYSHNDYAHLMMSVVADTEPNCREYYKQYVDLPEDYYDPDFHDYSYFTARFMTQVMTTLYTQSERFPNVIDCLLNAQPGQYFRTRLPDYSIAQKYGSFQDYSARNWNHTTGIIYLPNPIILTVMTLDIPSPEQTIGEIAELFANYSLGLDGKLEQYRASQEAERLAAEEEAQREAEEAARREAEQLAAQQEEAAQPAIGVTLSTPEPASGALPAENAALGLADIAQPSNLPRVYVLLGAGGVFVIAVLLRLLLRGRRV